MIQATCTRCGRTHSYDPIYADTMRPCPSCGEFVWLGDAGVSPTLGRRRKCWRCDAVRDPDSKGLAFELGWTQTTLDEPRAQILALFSVSLARDLSGHSQSECSVEGWACANHATRVRCARFWNAMRWVTAFLLPITGAIGFAWHRSRGGPDPEAVLFGLSLAFSVAGVLVSYGFYRVTLWVLCFPLKRALRAGGATAVRILREP